MRVQNITSIEIIVTESCNLKCKYCFQDKRNTIIDDMTVDNIIELTKEYGIKDITLFGGEPVSKFTLNKLKRISENYNGNIHICTNLFELDDEIMDWYISIKDRVYVQISIDGLGEYNGNRVDYNGNNSYNTVFRNLLKLSTILEPSRMTTRTVITPFNIEHIPDLVLYLYQLQMNNFICNSKIGFDQSGNTAYKKQNVFNMYNKIIDFYNNKQIDGFMFKSIFNLFGYDSNEKNLCCDCTMCKDYITINTDGKILPCHYTVGNDNIIMGNIVDKELNDDYMELFNQDDFKGLYNCKECKANTICTSCKMANYIKSGDILKQNIHFCEVNWWKYQVLSSRFDMDLFNPLTKEELEEITNNMEELSNNLESRNDDNSGIMKSEINKIKEYVAFKMLHD